MTRFIVEVKSILFLRKYIKFWWRQKFVQNCRLFFSTNRRQFLPLIFYEFSLRIYSIWIFRIYSIWFQLIVYLSENWKIYFNRKYLLFSIAFFYLTYKSLLQKFSSFRILCLKKIEITLKITIHFCHKRFFFAQ